MYKLIHFRWKEIVLLYLSAVDLYFKLVAYIIVKIIVERELFNSLSFIITL